jgi:hypothetical protein
MIGLAWRVVRGRVEPHPSKAPSGHRTTRPCAGAGDGLSAEGPIALNALAAWHPRRFRRAVVKRLQHCNSRQHQIAAMLGNHQEKLRGQLPLRRLLLGLWQLGDEGRGLTQGEKRLDAVDNWNRAIEPSRPIWKRCDLRKFEHCDLRSKGKATGYVARPAPLSNRRLDTFMASMTGTGVLREFNRAYKTRRQAAFARGEHFMNYKVALARLRSAMVPILMNNGQPVIGQSLFATIFDS